MAGEHESVDLVGDRTVEQFARAVLLAALTAALAQVSIPLPGGVPFSLQHFGAFFAGLLLGPLWGGFALLAYILAGAAGAPVYSNGGAGLGYLFGPTGGFLFGFLACAVVVGGIVHRRVEPRDLADVSIPVQVAAVLAGLAAIYLVGVPWMAFVTGLPLERAAAQMAPFFPPDVLKALIAVAVVRGGDLLRP